MTQILITYIDAHDKEAHVLTQELYDYPRVEGLFMVGYRVDPPGYGTISIPVDRIVRMEEMVEGDYEKIYGRPFRYQYPNVHVRPYQQRRSQ